MTIDNLYRVRVCGMVFRKERRIEGYYQQCLLNGYETHQQKYVTFPLFCADILEPTRAAKSHNAEQATFAVAI